MPAAQRILGDSVAKSGDLFWSRQAGYDANGNEYPRSQHSLDFDLEVLPNLMMFTVETKEFTPFNEDWTPEVLRKIYLGDRTRIVSDQTAIIEDDGFEGVEFEEDEDADLDIEDIDFNDLGELLTLIKYKFEIPRRTTRQIQALGKRSVSYNFLDSDGIPIDGVLVTANPSSAKIDPNDLEALFEGGSGVLDAEVEEDLLWHITLDDIWHLTSILQGIGLISRQRMPLGVKTLSRLGQLAA